jgi:hypothetical protein
VAKEHVQVHCCHEPARKILISSSRSWEVKLVKSRIVGLVLLAKTGPPRLVTHVGCSPPLCYVSVVQRCLCAYMEAEGCGHHSGCVWRCRDPLHDRANCHIRGGTAGNILLHDWQTAICRSLVVAPCRTIRMAALLVGDRCHSATVPPHHLPYCTSHASHSTLSILDHHRSRSFQIYLYHLARGLRSWRIPQSNGTARRFHTGFGIWIW